MSAPRAARAPRDATTGPQPRPRPANRRHPRSPRALRLAAAAGLAGALVLGGFAWSMAAGLGAPRLMRVEPFGGRSGTALAQEACARMLAASDPGPPQPSWPTTSGAAWIDRYRGQIVKRIETGEKVIALTFDDGPNGTTREVVDLLEARGAHATFFFRGKDLPIDEVVYAVEHGNEIGNHTVSHVALSESADVPIEREIDGMNRQILWIVGRNPLWVRARAGDVDAAGLAAIGRRGQLYANWNVNANDVDWSLSSDQIAANVLYSARPGSIVLLHQTRPDTIKALPKILDTLAARGYRCVTLSEMAAMGAQ